MYSNHKVKKFWFLILFVCLVLTSFSTKTVLAKKLMPIIGDLEENQEQINHDYEINATEKHFQEDLVENIDSDEIEDIVVQEVESEETGVEDDHTNDEGMEQSNSIQNELLFNSSSLMTTESTLKIEKESIIIDDLKISEINDQDEISILTSLEVGREGETYAITSTARSANKVLYEFWIKDLSVNQWIRIQDYGSVNIATWTPTKPGDYFYGVHVKDINSKERLDTHLYKSITIKEAPVNIDVPAEIIALEISGSNKLGETHKLTSSGKSENGVLYEFWIKDLSINLWTRIQDYSQANTTSWTPNKAGEYLYGVHIKDTLSKERLDTHLYKKIEISEVPTIIESLEISEVSNIENDFILNNLSMEKETGKEGKTYILTSTGTSANDVLYEFWIKDLSTNLWTKIQDYSQTNTASWTPIKEGSYYYGVHIKDSFSNERLDTHLYKTIDIKKAPTIIESLAISGINDQGKNFVLSSSDVGRERETYTITSLASSKNEVLYEFWIKDLGVNQWTRIQEYGTHNTAEWIPTDEGEYLFGVHIKDLHSQERLDTHLYKSVTIEGIPTEIMKLGIEGSKDTGNIYTITSSATSKNGVLYEFWIKDLSESIWTRIQDYGESKSARWIPEKNGEYLYGVHIKDSKSKERLETHQYMNISVKDVPTEIMTLDILGSNKVGETHNITTSGRSANGVLYEFWIKDLSTNLWTKIQDYSANNNTNWKPTKSGDYIFGVHIKDSKSGNRLDTHLYKNINIIGSQKTITIMLDPGHGGDDAGASYNGTFEKTLNLTVSKKVAERLERQGYNVVMTRTTDKYVDLYDRAAMANEIGVDIFVSIHHNAGSPTSASGIETLHYLVNTLHPPLPENAKTHNDPSRLEESIKLANLVQNELIKSTDARDRGLKGGSYVVVRETQMPAVLLELGFMSNMAELSRLKTDSYQNTMADAIARAINKYFGK